MSTREDLVAFAEKAAHDLNNTVAALSMAVEMALDLVPEGSDELESLLQRVQRNTNKLAGTVEGLPAMAEGWPLED